MAKDFDPDIGNETQFKTGAEQARIAQKAGIASGESKRRKRTLREMVEIFGELGVSDKTRKMMKELVQFTYEMVADGHCTLKGKGSKYRQFFFTKEMQEGARGKTGLVCVNRYGVPISTRGIAIQLKTFADKSGVPRAKIHPHAFRHFFAKMYLKKTKDVVSLADILGHGSVDITRIYLQKTHDEQKREFNRNVTW